jgi:hypothetical protein
MKKFASIQSFERTKYFEIIFFAALFFVRTCLPRRENWNLRSSLDLMLCDIIYMTDSLDFSKILFDDSRNRMDKDYKRLVLCTLAYTSCFYCLNVIYRPMRVHIRHVHTGRLSRTEQIELRLANDPFVQFIVPIVFFELPMTAARTIIFYTYKSVSWESFPFLLKNLVSIVLTVMAYFEIKSTGFDGVFFSTTVSVNHSV